MGAFVRASSGVAALLLGLGLALNAQGAGGLQEIRMPEAFKGLKPGLWESTETGTASSGGPPGMGMDPDQMQAMMDQQMAGMPPEQRARMQAMMKERMGGGGAQNPLAQKSRRCMTKADVDRGTFRLEELPGGREAREQCTARENSRTANSVSFAFDCTVSGAPGQAGKGSTTMTLQMVSPTEVRSDLELSGKVDGQAFRQKRTATDRWISAICGPGK